MNLRVQDCNDGSDLAKSRGVGLLVFTFIGSGLILLGISFVLSLTTNGTFCAISFVIKLVEEVIFRTEAFGTSPSARMQKMGNDDTIISAPQVLAGKKRN